MSSHDATTGTAGRTCLDHRRDNAAGSAAPHGHAALDIAVELNDVSKVYGRRSGRVTALDSVSLQVPAGRLLAVVGPSGSGKSTLLHCAAALDSPTTGSVRIGDTELAGLSETKRTVLRRDRIGFVFQSYNLVPSLTVQQNITLPARLAGRPVNREKLSMLLHRVNLSDRLHHLPAELSGGEQQRAAVVRALATEPDVVFADEPTGALDLRTATDVLDLLRDLVDDLGQTVVMVTHDPTAAGRAHQAVLMANGRITAVMEAPTPEEVSYRLISQERR